jgi:ABC-type antimicrobial peptide transport system permease subunit
VLSQALRVALLGTAIGLAAAIPAARLVRAQLYGVEPTDPTTLVAVIVVLVAASVAAAYVPARRATKVDPVVALRSD